MKKIWLAIITFLLAAAPLTAGAAVTETGDVYMLSGQETVEDNLYAAGGTVQVLGTVQGDALLAGGNLTLSGNVEQDLMVAGGTVLMLGDVGEDLRAAGGNVTVIGTVGGELVAVGGLISLSPDTVVGGDVWVSGGSVVIDGVIDGDVEVYGEEVQLAAKVTGSVTGQMNKLTILDGAEVGGNLVYEAHQPASVPAGAIVSGAIEYEKIKPQTGGQPEIEGALMNAKQTFAKVVAGMMLIKYLATLIAGLVLVALFGRKSDLLVNSTLDDFGNHLLLGLAVAVAAPIVLFVLLLTGLGSVVALIGFAALALLMMLGSIYAGIALGGWIRKVWTKSKQATGDWKSALLGITLMSLVVVVPVVGWLFKIVFVLAAVGAVTRFDYEMLKKIK